MPTKKALHVLVATDGSPHARAAIATVVHFPWPEGTRVRAVVARRSAAEYRRSILLSALDRGAELAASAARRSLSGRWPDVDVVIVDKMPADAILAEAGRFAADVIVLGWRGHGPVRRLLMGTVSRTVARRTSAAVLVVRRAQRVRRILVGLADSQTSRQALALVARLQPPSGGRVTLMTALHLLAVPSRGLVARAVAAEVRHTNLTRSKAATRQLNRAAALLKRRGWRTRTLLVTGEPLHDLLRTVTKERADLLVLGAKGAGAFRHLLLGSVAEGALNHSPVPVLVARRDAR